MYNCDTLMKLLYPYLDGELDVKESLRVQTHLQECPYCLEIFRQEKEFLQAFKNSVSIQMAPQGLREKISKALSPSASWNPVKEQKISGVRTLFSPTSVLAATMAMLVMVIAGLILYALPKQVEKRNMELVKVAVENHEGIIKGKIHFDIMSSEPAAILKWLEQELDFPVVLPREIPVMQLVGGKLVHFRDPAGGRGVPAREKKAALLIFESKGGKVSLLMASPQRLQALEEKAITFGFPGSPKSLAFYLAHYQGYYALAWTDPKLSYVLVSNQKRKITEACRICHENTHPLDFSEFDQQI